MANNLNGNKTLMLAAWSAERVLDIVLAWPGHGGYRIDDCRGKATEPAGPDRERRVSFVGNVLTGNRTFLTVTCEFTIHDPTGCGSWRHKVDSRVRVFGNEYAVRWRYPDGADLGKRFPTPTVISVNKGGAR